MGEDRKTLVASAAPSPVVGRESPALEHIVRRYDAQSEGMQIVSGWQVYAQITATSGRKFAPVAIALCSTEEDAIEIAELLDAKYAALSPEETKP